MSDEIKVNEFLTPEQIRDDNSFNESELNDAMIRQAALMAYYGQLVGEAQFQVDKFKMLLDIKEAQTAQRLRDELADEGKKVTEKMLEQAIMTSPTIIKHRIALNKAKRVYETMRGAMEGLRAKKDMLIQFGVRHRVELEQQTRIMKREGAEAEREAGIKAGKEAVTDTIARLREKKDAA